MTSVRLGKNRFASVRNRVDCNVEIRKCPPAPPQLTRVGERHQTVVSPSATSSNRQRSERCQPHGDPSGRQATVFTGSMTHSLTKCEDCATRLCKVVGSCDDGPNLRATHQNTTSDDAVPRNRAARRPNFALPYICRLIIRTRPLSTNWSCKTHRTVNDVLPQDQRSRGSVMRF